MNKKGIARIIAVIAAWFLRHHKKTPTHAPVCRNCGEPKESHVGDKLACVSKLPTYWEPSSEGRLER